jgi:hypothetical protein
MVEQLRGPFGKFVDWRQCAAVMQREAVTIIQGCGGEGNVEVAWSSSLIPSLQFELLSF